MHHGLSLLAYLALAAAPFAEAAKSTTRTSTVTVFLPPRSTGSASNIYASLITKDSSKTKYLLACQTAFSSPYTCDGDFKGVTVTYSASEMDVALDATTYDCKLASSSAVCATKTASSASQRTTTLNSSQSSAWMTPITVLDVEKKTTKKSTKATATAAAAVCKRASNSNSGSSGSSSGSSSSKSSSSSKNSKTKKKSGNSCSGAVKMTWDMGVVGVVGAGLAIAIAL